MAKDLFHEAAKIALQKDGWTITHDPYRIDTKQPKFDYEIDLGAERFIGAEKGTEKIAVEPGRRSGEEFCPHVHRLRISCCFGTIHHIQDCVAVSGTR